MISDDADDSPVGSPWGSEPEQRRFASQNQALLEVLQEVQTKSLELYPPETVDDTDEFGLKLLGTEDNGAPSDKLLEKLMGQLTDRVLSTRVKVHLSVPLPPQAQGK